MILKIKANCLITLALIIFIASGLSAQKVKYKDLFVLLSANDFDQSEPFLRRFIKDEPDHANANLYMGRLFGYKANSLDILKETQTYSAYCDSSVYFYRQAYTLIDDKEIKKNDEYYQEYSRRDLRTGNFGVKLADIKFDLEKRIGDTEKLSSDVKKLREYFDNTEAEYNKAETTYLDLVGRFNNMTALLMKSTNSDVDSLKKIGEAYDQFIKNFQSYKQVLGTAGGGKYNQKLNKKFLEGLTMVSSPDFYNEEIVVYDFKTWTDKTTKVIVEDIKPMKANMSEYDRQLDELLKQVTEDSLAVENELASLTEKMMFEQLKNYDPEPLPSLIFNFKVDEISYHSYYNQIGNELDSANVDYQISLYSVLLEKFKWMYDAYYQLAKTNAVEKTALYSEFVTDRFGNISNLVSYIAEKGEKVTEEEAYLKGKFADLNERSHWGLYQNDSIPLFLSEDIRLIPSDSFIYKTLAVDSISDGYIAFGIKFNDGKPKNYITKIGYDRQVDTIFFQILKTKVQIDSMARLESWSAPYKNEKGIIFVTRISRLAATGEMIAGFEISNFEPETGIKWSSTFENNATVKELNVDPDNGLIVVKMGLITNNGPGAVTENLVFNFSGSLMTTLGN